MKRVIIHPFHFFIDFVNIVNVTVNAIVLEQTISIHGCHLRFHCHNSAHTCSDCSTEKHRRKHRNACVYAGWTPQPKLVTRVTSSFLGEGAPNCSARCLFAPSLAERLCGVVLPFHVSRERGHGTLGRTQKRI
jgi:hypothetical protein